MLMACATDATDTNNNNSFTNDTRSEVQTSLRYGRSGQETNKKKKSKNANSRYIKGSSRNTWDDVSESASTSSLMFRALQDMTLNDPLDRKQAPRASKDDLRLDKRISWRDRLVLSHAPSTAPSASLQPTKTQWPSTMPSKEPTFQPSSNPSLQPSEEPSSTPTSTPTINDEFIPGQLVVGAYYYPWHADDFHNDEGYLRQDLNPPQQPQLGEYDDRSPSVITQHLHWSRQANINLWVTSWWGPNSQSDLTIRNNILPHPTLRKHKIAVFYETMGRIRAKENFSLQRVESDMQHLCANYFDHPNYYTVNDSANGPRPVLFIYLTRTLANQSLLRVVTELMRITVRETCGKELYIVGDQVFGFASDKDFVGNINHYHPFLLLDAVTNYDVYGSVAQIVGRKGGTLTQAQVEYYYQEEQALWKQGAAIHNCQYIPSVSPGYNDLSVRPEAANPPLSRSLSQDSPGSLFTEALKHAIPLAETSGLNGSRGRPDRMLMVNSFNEWHEDTQIEPTVGTVSSFPKELTFAFTYEGFGDKYLEILRVGTEKEIDGLLS